MGKQQKAAPAVIDVDAADKWPTAATVSEKRTIKTVKGPMTFEVRALSSADWEAVDGAHPLPEPPIVKRGREEKPDPTDPAYLKERTAVLNARVVALVDKCWKPLPGGTVAAKVAWVETHLMRVGDLAELHNEILSLSGFAAGSQDDEALESEDAVEVKSPEDWAKATEATVGFAFSRAGQRLRFKLHGIANSKIKAIEAATDPGVPPLDVTGTSNIPGRRQIPQPNPDNPGYKAKCEALQHVANALTIEAACGFALPGSNDNEKAKWLSERPAGEVATLLGFIRFKILNYRDWADF